MNIKTTQECIVRFQPNTNWDGEDTFHLERVILHTVRENYPELTIRVDPNFNMKFIIRYENWNCNTLTPVIMCCTEDMIEMAMKANFTLVEKS